MGPAVGSESVGADHGSPRFLGYDDSGHRGMVVRSSCLERVERRSVLAGAWTPWPSGQPSQALQLDLLGGAEPWIGWRGAVSYWRLRPSRMDAIGTAWSS